MTRRMMGSENADLAYGMSGQLIKESWPGLIQSYMNTV